MPMVPPRSRVARISEAVGVDISLFFGGEDSRRKQLRGVWNRCSVVGDLHMSLEVVLRRRPAVVQKKRSSVSSS